MHYHFADLLEDQVEGIALLRGLSCLMVLLAHSGAHVFTDKVLGGWMLSLGKMGVNSWLFPATWSEVFSFGSFNRLDL